MTSAADRQALARAFAEDAGWANADMRPLAGDASSRRYWRLERGDGPDRSAVLMDASPSDGEDVVPFLRIGNHLAGLGFSAPRILAEDRVLGFLLLEDLGDALFARVVSAEPHLETELYEAAVDVLVALCEQGLPQGIPAYGPDTMAERATLAATWYLPGLTGAPPSPALSTALAELTRAALQAHAGATDTLVLRDYHAENLIWLPERTGIARVGLLDFQDAMAGHPAYDLVSLLDDARRDVALALKAAMIDRYLAATGEDRDRFTAACAVLGAQRALRILGVFARLCLHFGKPAYVDLIPRVWDQLQRNLEHPAAAPLAQVARELPAPTAANLAHLKERAGTCPTR